MRHLPYLYRKDRPGLQSVGVTPRPRVCSGPVHGPLLFTVTQLGPERAGPLVSLGPVAKSREHFLGLIQRPPSLVSLEQPP